MKVRQPILTLSIGLIYDTHYLNSGGPLCGRGEPCNWEPPSRLKAVKDPRLEIIQTRAVK